MFKTRQMAEEALSSIQEAHPAIVARVGEISAVPEKNYPNYFYIAFDVDGLCSTTINSIEEYYRLLRLAQLLLEGSK